eukprot:COSAG04_NODE_12145_length_668_cov_0.817223_1_plen_126_part_10
MPPTCARAPGPQSTRCWPLLRAGAASEPVGVKFKIMEGSQKNRVAAWGVGEVVEWVKQLGLPEAAAAFGAQEIAGSELLDLTEADLKVELGVRKLGHIMKLRKALDTLRLSEQRVLRDLHAATAEA